MLHPMILSVIPPSVSRIFNKILETSKIVDAVCMTKEQFKHHIQKRSQSWDFHNRA